MKTLDDWVKVAGVAFAVAGCGGNAFSADGIDAGGTGGVNSDAATAISDDQACGDRAHANCVKFQTCSPEVLSTTYGSEGTCETRLKLNCLNALAATSNGNSAQATEACAQAFAGLSCADFFDLKPAAACLQSQGALANGQLCGAPGQCATGFCAILPGSPCGNCTPAPEAGHSCAQLTTCGQLLVCVASTKLCMAYAAEGAACDAGQPCGAGLFCVGETSVASGTCQPAVEQASMPCDPNGKTAPGCDRLAGLTCNTATKECTMLAFGAAGQPCGANVNDQFGACANAATCIMSMMGDAGAAAASCVPVAADGAACDFAHGPNCLEPARCVVPNDAGTIGKCEFPNPLACH
jgi:hypothetical protein